MFRNKRLKTRSLSQSVRLKKDKNIAVAVGYAPPNRSATTARPSILSSSHSCTGATWSSSTFKESEYTGWISTFTLYRSLLRGEGGKVCHAHTHTHNTKTASTEARFETVVMLLWVKNKTSSVPKRHEPKRAFVKKSSADKHTPFWWDRSPSSSGFPVCRLYRPSKLTFFFTYLICTYCIYYTHLIYFHSYIKIFI